jgi:hypothetical protein
VHAPFIRAIASFLIAAGILAGCVTGVERPDDCGDPSVVRVATLTSDHRLEPDAITVCLDQQVTLEVDVQTDGVLHLHGYDDQTSAQEVTAGTPVTLTFDAVHPGQFVIELHTADGPAGLGVGILTVDAP